MHPISRRSIIYLILLLLIIVSLAMLCLFQPVFVLFFFIVPAFIAENQLSLAQKFISGLVLNTISLLLFTISYLLLHYFIKLESYDFVISIGFAMVAAILLHVLVSKIMKRVFDAAKLEDRYHRIFKHYPNLICETHDTRPVLKKYFGYQNVVCKVGNKDCVLDNKIKHAKNVIGLIGKYTKSINLDGDYYVLLWDEENKQMRITDCNIIEIHESDKIKDYDAVISKLVQLIYNEVDRTFPIEKIPVRVIGHPKLKESTWRLMKERFLEVEPSESEYLRYC